MTVMFGDKCAMSGDRRNLWLKRLIKISVVAVGLYAVMQWIADRHKESSEIDNGNVYIRSDHGSGKRRTKPLTVYEAKIKPAIDRVLSLVALFVLSPLFAAISLAIYIDDPGPVFFIQKRVGKDKRFFALHKFRSMKVSTPHDVPTHQLENPEQYITKVGKVLRKTSLDELPQIWDIFSGKMSIIGPRPALWNQEDLVEEREKYGANDVMPGLTGWAQINGRDELEIEEKARLDGEYAEALRSGSLNGIALDIKCFVKTVISVLKTDGVVEGGTGKLNNYGECNCIKDIKISIITPAYNAAQYLAECIGSVQSQTYENWEMIIVDDASEDNTYSIAEEYAMQDKRIKLIRHNVNYGVAKARNMALSVASGGYIAFLDADDFWDRNKLYRQLYFMEENLYAFSYTAYQKINANTGEKGKVIKVPKTMTYEKIFGNTSIACLTVMINRKAVGNFRMPPLKHTEDQCTWQEILNRGYVAYGINEVLAYYREGNDSLTKNKEKSAMLQWQTYRKYYRFGVLKSIHYFIKYACNAVLKYL